MTTPDLLSHYETCYRKGYWSQTWRRPRLHPNEFLHRAIRAGLTEPTRKDYGEVAGETVMDLGENPGMDLPPGCSVYQSVIHHAALADTLTQALRRPKDDPWLLPPPVTLPGAPWASSALLDPTGTKLRQVVLVSSWNDARHYQEVRSWRGLGEVAAYELPMTMAVVILGQLRNGRRSGAWTKGFLHPNSHQLRFRKKSKTSYETFSDRWEPVWREDRGEIATEDWLQAMLSDDILRDLCFKVEIEVPGKIELLRIRELASAKLDAMEQTRKTPEPSMSVCDRPPCPFLQCCWSTSRHEPSEKKGFVQIELGRGKTVGTLEGIEGNLRKQDSTQENGNR